MCWAADRTSWSPDGTLVAGALRRGDGFAAGIATFSLETKKYQRVPKIEIDGAWALPLWLDDNRRLLVRDGRGLWIVHAETGETRRLLSVRGYAVGRSVGLSRDNRWITYTETGTEGDIWIATLNK